jgi:hypothetical protein
MKCPKCNIELEIQFTKDEFNPIDYYKCPKCLSHNRHRLIYVLLKDKNNGKMLEYSPVKITKETFNHFTADFPPRTSELGVVMADVKDDLTDSQFKDNEFDTVICSHVLDSIKEEEKAIKELHRITKNTAIISAPIFEELEKTIEEPYLSHKRKCGLDYFERFNVFSKVEIIKGDNYPEYGCQGEYIAICQK